MTPEDHLLVILRLAAARRFWCWRICAWTLAAMVIPLTVVMEWPVVVIPVVLTAVAILDRVLWAQARSLLELVAGLVDPVKSR